MVRVVFAHHFDGQTIQTCDDAVALTVASRDKLLLALSHCMVEVRDLSEHKNPSYTFSTIDQASFLEHCITGNYIVTLESKVTRQGRETVYTRVYANWDQNVDGNPAGPAMRARIAGRVTPTSSQTGDGCLEMIELPVKFPSTSCIACCQETGNILIACNTSLCMFQLVSKTHDISKVKFLDFELWPITLELSFVPSKIQMVEDIISVTNTRTIQVFRINKSVTKSSDLGNPSNKQKNKEQNGNDKTSATKTPTCINLDELIKCATENNIEPPCLPNESLPFMVLLPSISSDVHNSTYRISPFKPGYAVNLPITIKEMPANEPWAERMSTMVEHLMQLEMITQSEEVCTVVLRALYKSQKNASVLEETSNLPRFHSFYYSHMVAINCLVATHQEAFLYHFPVEHSTEGTKIGEGQCITTYSFTSSVINVVLEPFFLHALTHNNLETYTMRTTHHALSEDKKLQNIAENTVSLVGLRPFLNVVDLIYSLSYLIVIAASDSGTWTVYLLKLPSAAALYHDIVALASNHQFTALTLYAHLLAEAHSILETAVSLSTFPGSSLNHELDQELYAESCMLMGDYYIGTSSTKDWILAYYYYTKANASPSVIMDRLKKLEYKAKEDDIELNTTPGFVHYLTMYLNDWSEHKGHELPHTAMSLLIDLAQNTGVSVQLSSLVLKSPQLSEYFPERTIHIIQKELGQDNDLQVENVLALCLLLLQRDKLEEATNIIQAAPKSSRFSDQMVQVLEQHTHLLFDDGDMLLFSELSLLLMLECPCEISLVLSKLITERKQVDLKHMVQVFLRLSNPGPHISLVLQLLLEQVLSIPEFQDFESIKILVRSYLSDIQRNSQECVIEGIQNFEKLFKTMRPSFLKELPSTLTLTSKSQLSLMKLECLLCSNWLSKQCKEELCQYISTILPDCISLQILCQPHKAVELLSNSYPQVIPVYAKDMFDKNEQWKSLVEYLKNKADEGGELSDVYSNALKEILSHLANCMTVEQLSDILPPGSSSTYQHYLLRCQQIGQADHLRSLIMATGHQLLTTLQL